MSQAMTRTLKVITITAVTYFLSACLAYTPSPATGYAFTNVRGPVTATSSPKEPTRVGRSSVTSLAGWIAVGDASIQTAAKNGGITEIHHVDYEAQSIFGVQAKYTIVVYGN